MACGGVVRTKLTGAMLGGTLRGRTSLGGTLLGGTVAVGTVLVGTCGRNFLGWDRTCRSGARGNRARSNRAWRNLVGEVARSLRSAGARDVKNYGRAFAARRGAGTLLGRLIPSGVAGHWRSTRFRHPSNTWRPRVCMRTAKACFAATSVAPSISRCMRRRSSRSPRRARRRRASWSRWISSWISSNLGSWG